MYVDKNLLFAEALAITASAASTSYLDLQSIRDIGAGKDLYLVVNVVEAFTDGSSDSTVQVDIETDDNTSFSSATAVQRVGTFAALSAIGAKKVVKISPAVIAERYVRLYFTVANGNLTTGKFDAYLTVDAESANKIYADNSTITD